MMYLKKNEPFLSRLLKIKHSLGLLENSEVVEGDYFAARVSNPSYIDPDYRI